MPDLVSIIIPAYNAERFISDAIRSALEQTYQPVEVIVVDDGSTDGTLSLAKDFDSARLRVVSQPNSGAGRARNHGLELAKGSFIKYLDADDALTPTAIERQVAEAKLQPGDIVFGRMHRSDEDLTPMGDPVYAQMGHSPELVRQTASQNREDVVASLLRWTPQTSCPLHLRHQLEAIGGFNEALGSGQEYDLHLRLALNGNRFVAMDDPVVRVREHQSPDRITVAKTDRSYASRYRSDKMAYWADLIDAGFEESIPGPVRMALAEMAWRHFRTAHSRGDVSASARALSIARSYDPRMRATRDVKFRALARVIGPYYANGVASLYRNMRSKVRVGF